MHPFRILANSGPRNPLDGLGQVELMTARLDDVLSRVAPGTNGWIDEDEQVAAWQSGRADLNWVAPGQDWTMKMIKKIWFYGAIGTGRSTVAACMVQKLLEMAQPRHAVCYFFPVYNKGEGDFISILKTLIAQLATQNDAAGGDYQRSFVQKLMPAGANGDATTTFDADDERHLSLLLVEMSKNFERVSLIVSRIDCMLPRVITGLASLVDMPGSSIWTAFTSNDKPDMQELCMETISCPIGIIVSPEDLRLYVRNEIQRRMTEGASYLHERPDAVPKIEDYVVKNSSQRWAWAIALLIDQLDMLERDVWQESDAEEHAPVLDSYLMRILHDLDPLPKFILKTVSRWLCATYCHPILQLTASEMCICLLALFRATNPSTKIQHITEEQISKACGPLVRRITNGVLEGFHLAHPAIYSYLMGALAHYVPPLNCLHYDGHSLAKTVGELRDACGVLSIDHPSVAERIYKCVLELEETNWGPDESDTLVTAEHLGDLFLEQGRLEEAEKWFRHILAGYQRNAPKNPENESNVINLLAITCKRQGKFDEAESLYKAAIEGRRRLYGENDGGMTKYMDNLGKLYAAQDRTAEAQQVWKQCLAHYERHLGDDHKSTIMAVYNIGLTHKILGQLDEAERLLGRAHQGYARTEGAEHGGTLDAASALGHTYILLRKMEDAEAVYLDLLAKHERVSGPLSENALETCHSLAKVYQDVGRLGEAETLCYRALHGFEQTLGPDHVVTTDVAYTLFLQMEPAEGVELGERVLRSFERIHGPHARVTNSTADNLGLMYAKLGRLEDAEPMWKRAFEGHTDKRGPADELTLAAANNLGLLYKMLGRRQEAEEWLVRSLTGYEALEDREDATERIRRELRNL